MAYADMASGLSPACSGSDADAQRDSYRLSDGMERDRGKRSRECRNRYAGLKRAKGPRRYGRGLVAARYVTCRPDSSVPGGSQAGQGRRLAARMLRDCLLTGSDGSFARTGWRSALPWDAGRAVEALSSHRESVWKKFRRAFNPPVRFARPRRLPPACSRIPACSVCRRWCCGLSKSGCPWTRRWRSTTSPSRTG